MTLHYNLYESTSCKNKVVACLTSNTLTVELLRQILPGLRSQAQCVFPDHCGQRWHDRWQRSCPLHRSAPWTTHHGRLGAELGNKKKTQNQNSYCPGPLGLNFYISQSAHNSSLIWSSNNTKYLAVTVFSGVCSYQSSYQWLWFLWWEAGEFHLEGLCSLTRQTVFSAAAGASSASSVSALSAPQQRMLTNTWTGQQSTCASFKSLFEEKALSKKYREKTMILKCLTKMRTNTMNGNGV